MLYFRYHNTNCCFAKSDNSDKLLAIDAGWPNTLHEYAKCLKQIGFRLDQISWAIVTHFHMDHAGLISKFLDRGITCYVFEQQIGFISQMEKTILKNDKKYKLIDQNKLSQTKMAEFKKILQSIGIDGEVISTTCHSPDSITFIMNQEAMIGDMSPQYMPDDERCTQNWQLLKEKGIEMIYPSHAMPCKLIEIV